jgi:hypothetical protein
MTIFQLLNHYSDSEILIYALCTTTVCFIGYLVIKSYLYNAPIATPNSPQTFNLTSDQIDTLNKIIDRWDELENVNEDIQNIIGEEVFDRMENKFEDLENKIEDRFEDLENELLDSFEYPFEDLINSPFENSINLEIIFLIFIVLCFLILWKMRNNPWIKYFVHKFLMIHQVEIRILSIVLAKLNYIEPTQAINNNLDFLGPQYPTYARVSNHTSYYERFSSYGNPPSYQTIESINCPLEDYINLDHIWISFILGLLFLLLVNYYILTKSNSQMIFTKGISTEVITFRKNYQQVLSSKLNKGDRGFFINFGEIQNLILRHGWTEEVIKVWLDSLNDQDYSVTIEILTDLTVIRPDWILFSKEFIVNYNSNPILITLLINDQLLELYNTIDIYSHYSIVIHYIPLTKTDFNFIESYYSKRERR